MPQTPSVQMLIAAVIVVAVIALRSRQLLQERPLNLVRLWILPTVVSVLVVVFGSRAPFTAALIVALLVAVASGACLGWFRAKTMTLRRTASGQITAKGSILAVVVLVAIVAARYALRYLLAAKIISLPLSDLSADLVLAAFAAALLLARCAELTIRSRSLPSAV